MEKTVIAHLNENFKSDWKVQRSFIIPDSKYFLLFYNADLQYILAKILSYN